MSKRDGQERCHGDSLPVGRSEMLEGSTGNLFLPRLSKLMPHTIASAVMRIGGRRRHRASGLGSRKFMPCGVT